MLLSAKSSLSSAGSTEWISASLIRWLRFCRATNRHFLRLSRFARFVSLDRRHRGVLGCPSRHRGAQSFRITRFRHRDDFPQDISVRHPHVFCRVVFLRFRLILSWNINFGFGAKLRSGRFRRSVKREKRLRQNGKFWLSPLGGLELIGEDERVCFRNRLSPNSDK